MPRRIARCSQAPSTVNVTDVSTVVCIDQHQVFRSSTRRWVKRAGTCRGRGTRQSTYESSLPRRKADRRAAPGAPRARGVFRAVETPSPASSNVGRRTRERRSDDVGGAGGVDGGVVGGRATRWWRGPAPRSSRPLARCANASSTETPARDRAAPFDDLAIVFACRPRCRGRDQRSTSARQLLEAVGADVEAECCVAMSSSWYFVEDHARECWNHLAEGVLPDGHFGAQRVVVDDGHVEAAARLRILVTGQSS